MSPVSSDWAGYVDAPTLFLHGHSHLRGGVTVGWDYAPVSLGRDTRMTFSFSTIEDGILDTASSLWDAMGHGALPALGLNSKDDVIRLVRKAIGLAERYDSGRVLDVEVTSRGGSPPTIRVTPQPCFTEWSVAWNCRSTTTPTSEGGKMETQAFTNKFFKLNRSDHLGEHLSRTLAFPGGEVWITDVLEAPDYFVIMYEKEAREDLGRPARTTTMFEVKGRSVRTIATWRLLRPIFKAGKLVAFEPALD